MTNVHAQQSGPNANTSANANATPGRMRDLAQRGVAVLALAVVCAGTTAALVTSAEDVGGGSGKPAPRPAVALAAPVGEHSIVTMGSPPGTQPSESAPADEPTTEPAAQAASDSAATLSPEEQRAMLDTLASANPNDTDGPRRPGGAPNRGPAPGGRGPRPGQMGLGGFGGGAGGAAARGPAPTTQESEDAIDFVSKHSPNRYAVFNRLPVNSQPRQRMVNMMTNVYRNLQRSKDQDPEVYELMVKRFELEDSLFDFEFRRRLIRGDDSNARSELRAKAAEIVQLSLREREKRIERLERALDTEKKALAADRANPEALVDGHAKRLMAQLRDWGERWREFRNRNGWYPGGGGGPRVNPPANAAPASDRAEPHGAADGIDVPGDSDLAMTDEADLANLFGMLGTTTVAPPAR